MYVYVYTYLSRKKFININFNKLRERIIFCQARTDSGGIYICAASNAFGQAQERIQIVGELILFIFYIWQIVV